MPSPRARGSTRNRRSLPTVREPRTRKMQPTGWPSRSAIQHRSRSGSKCSTNFATMPGHQRLEALVVAVLLGVQRAVARDHPAHVAGARRAQHVAAAPRAARSHEQSLDGAHGLDQPDLLGIRTGARASRRSASRAPASSGSNTARPCCGELEVALAAVVGRARGDRSGRACGSRAGCGSGSRRRGRARGARSAAVGARRRWCASSYSTRTSVSEKGLFR